MGNPNDIKSGFIRRLFPIRRGGWINNLLLVLGAAGTLQAADSISEGRIPEVLTNIGQLHHLSQGGQRAMCSVHLEGVVCAASPAKGELFLSDEFGATRIKLNSQGQSLQPGARVLVTGNGVVEETELRMDAQPLVDNDGTHALNERSGMVFLRAGRHPIRVGWFNKDGDFGLEVYFQGPDLPRQRIPNSTLFRTDVDPGSGSTNFVQGLNYRYFESTNLNSLPEFNQLTPVRTGTVANFDVSVMSRTNDMALEFTGYVEVPRDGVYTFSTASDDGSRLFIGEAQARLDVLGSAQPPAPRSIIIGEALSEANEQQWSEAQGTVVFASEQPNGYELELISGTGRMRLDVADDSSNAPMFLLNSQIRVKGISRSIRTSEGQKVAGAMFVASWNQIELLQLAAENWTASPLAPIGSLMTNNLAWTNGTIVRVRGKLRTEAPDQPLLEDATGKILVEGLHVSPETFGARLELLGKLNRKGTNCVLQNGFYQEIMTSGNGTGEELPVLTSAKQIHYLSREEAKRQYPVRIRGVIISTIVWRQSFIIQDATHGIFVQGIPEASPPRIGDFFEVEGVTDPGDFAPTVQATRVMYLGAGLMPEPLHPNRDQLINGSLDAQYVELQGIVTAIATNTLTLLTLAGKYDVDMVDARSQNLTQFENTLIRIKGCFISSWDSQTKRIRIGKIRFFYGSINVDEPAPADVFEAPVKTAAELLLFDAKASALKRIKVQGQVVRERAGEYYLMNETNGLRFFLKAPVSLTLGDRVEVVGFPELGGASPVLREAIVRKTGMAALPRAEPLPADRLLSADHDATLVQIEAQLVGVRASQTEQELELQAGSRTFLAQLDTRNGPVPEMAPGSLLQLTGVYAGHGGDRTAGRDIDSFGLLLNAPTDVKILQSPSWWTIGHALVVVGALITVLLLSIAWITGLRRQVTQRTRQLKDEIEQRKQTQGELEVKKESLEKEIEERKRMESEVERTHKQLVDVSRQAGQAEVASSVLHNVGNVLNSVNVSAGVVVDRIQASKALAGVTRIAELLADHQHDLVQFLTSEGRAEKVPVYLKGIVEQLKAEQATVFAELQCLTGNISHIKEIVAMQQNYARVSGVTEIQSIPALLEDALRMHAASLERHDAQIIRQFETVPDILVDKHKVLQILINLITNAKWALSNTTARERILTLGIALNGDNLLRVSVSDNGIGITPENLKRIFTHGFTTRKDGHGFGLHGAVLSAREMGGNLLVHSDGPGKGATFTLELPCQSKDNTHEPSQSH